MKATALGKSQKAVLYADIGHPELTDTELSKIVGISPGRISTIRSQLIHDGFYREIKLPSFDLLGFEGIGVISAEMSESYLLDIQAQKKMIDDLGKNPSLIYAVQNGDQLLFIAAFPKLTSFEAFSDDVFEVCCRISNNDCDVIVASFPMEISKIHSLWDFSSLLHDKFALNISQQRRMLSYGKVSHRPELSNDDVTILDMLLREPVANDINLAKKAGVSLSTFRRIKERIMSQGLCRRAFIPEVSSLGFELCVFSLLRLNPTRPKLGEVDHLRSLITPWPFLMMTRKSKAFIGYCFSDYTSYSKFSSSVLSDLKKESVHMDVIKTIYCSTASMREIKKLDFSGVLTPLLHNR